MTHWNVIMVVPPLTITREEAEEGVAILDDVLAIADEHVARGPRERRGRTRRGTRDGGGRLVERVPEHRVAARDGHDLEQVAERLAMRVEQVVVREVRVRAEHEERRHRTVSNAGGGRRHLRVRVTTHACE